MSATKFTEVLKPSARRVAVAAIEGGELEMDRALPHASWLDMRRVVECMGARIRELEAIQAAVAKLAEQDESVRAALGLVPFGMRREEAS